MRGKPGPGFSLVELLIAASLMLIVVAIALQGLVHILRGSARADAQNELDVEVQIAIEKIKAHLRLSSLDMMFYFPAGTGSHTAVSFPLGGDADGDGAIDIDPATQRIDWKQTLIYHVWLGQPNELLLTTFDPRDNALTTAQRQAQIDYVATRGTGSGITGVGAEQWRSTQSIFKNLFNWKLNPRGATFDGYAPQTLREVASLGTVMLTPGTHQFRFSVIGANPAARGKYIGIDNLIRVGRSSDGTREAEAQSVSNATPLKVPYPRYMAGGSWSGNWELFFPATAVGHAFTLLMENDRWEETNFQTEGDTHDKTAVVFDPALSNFVVRLRGNDVSWQAARQTGDTVGGTFTNPPSWTVLGSAVRVLLRGQEMVSGNWIDIDGARCRLAFRAGQDAAAGKKLIVNQVYIAESASHTNLTPNATSARAAVLFSGGTVGVVPAGGTLLSDYVNFAIDRQKSYQVSFLVVPSAKVGLGWLPVDPVAWKEVRDPRMTAWVITNAATALPGATSMDTWTGAAGLVPTNCVIGLDYLFVSYPVQGTYTSRAYDTAQLAPAYSQLRWAETVPTGGDVIMRVRSGVDRTMAGATAWTNLLPISSSPAALVGALSPGSSRYVQFQATLLSSADRTATPRLLDSTIRWTGVPAMVDITGTFTRAVSNGTFQLTVDGVTPKTGVRLDLEIYKWLGGYGSLQRRIFSACSAEVSPRNTGK